MKIKKNPIMIYVSDSLHKKLVITRRMEDSSMNDLINRLLTRSLKSYKVKEKPLQTEEIEK